MSQNDLMMVEKDTVGVVANKVREFQEKGELHLPANYSAYNSLKSAWLILQSTVNREKQPVLQSCTKDSIANSLLDMVVQGLNPAKKQGYFIAYGKQLSFQRSYFGTMAVTKQAAGAKDIFAQVVYKGDEFEYEIKGAKKEIKKHVQKIENVNGDNIVAAYCVIEFDDGAQFADIMTMDQIRKAWSKSKMNPDKDGSTHKEFPGDMARKTVINRTCKTYINSSNDSNLVIDHFNRADEVAQEAGLEEEIAANANGEPIDVESEYSDEETKPGPQPEEEQKQPTQESQRDIFENQKAGADGPGF